MPDKMATITEHRLHETDTGSRSAVALLTGRINHLTEHSNPPGDTTPGEG